MEELQNAEVLELPIADEKQWCVYMHTNKANGKVYIGVSKGDPKRRWGRNGSGYSKQQQSAFASAIEKYTWDGFEHAILATNLSQKEAWDMEIELIAFYKSNVSRWHNQANGYNMTDGGDGACGRRLSDEAKRRISEANKGKPSPMKNCFHTEEVKRKISKSKIGRFCGEDNPNYNNHKLVGENNPNYGNGFPIVQFDKNGVRIAEYRTSGDAEKETGVSQSNIRRCCRGEIYSTGGFMWKFAKDCADGNIKPYINPKHKPVVQLDLSNNVIQTFDSMNEAAMITNIPNSNITVCCKGLTQSAGGFRWMYKEDYEKQLKNLNNND